MNKIIKQTAKNLKRRGFNTYVCSNSKEAVKKVLDIIPENKSVGIGGSMTVKEMGLDKELIKNNRKICSHWIGEVSDILEAFEDERTADYYLCSTNALLVKGALVNTDGLGNRVSYMFHGPKEVIIVCGRNKIVDGSYEDAINRVRNIASPKNNVRLGFNTPCSKSGECHDCLSPERICCVTTIIDMPPNKPLERRIHVVIVDEDLGY